MNKSMKENYTSLNQASKLSEFLDIRTSDATYERIAIAGAALGVPEEMQYKLNTNMPFWLYSGIGVPAWSLTALLELLPEAMLIKNKDGYELMFETVGGVITTKTDDPVHTCVDMIVKLHEQNIL